MLPPRVDDVFDIDEILANDKEIVVDPNDPELMCSKYLYVIKKIEAEIERCKFNADAMIQEVTQWLDKKIEQKRGQIDFMSNFMRNYLKQKNFKSLALPTGSIGFRKQPDKVEITDEEKFMEFATFDIIRVEPEKFVPDMNAIKAKLKETGELPEGVELITPEPKFYYKLNGKK